MPHQPTRAAAPTRTPFDAWSSSSTGHQRAENRLSGSTSWRDSRNRKLAAQLGGGSSGGRRVADSVGAGSEGFGRDGRTATGGWVRGAKGLRGEGQRSLWECVGERGRGSEREWGEGGGGVEEEDVLVERWKVGEGLEERNRPPSGQGEGYRSGGEPGVEREGPIREETSLDDDAGAEEDHISEIGRKPRPPQIFRNLTFYINGSTMPLISDHKLKHLISSHGGNLSVALGRRTVTHVIVGVPCSSKSDVQGSGGGLAASKIQKEIMRVRGKGVKFVGVDWMLASVKAGTRLSEARFETVKIGGAGQRSVLPTFEKRKEEGER
ncbi:MAG: hypothetical protein Q9165_001485 [Trypethelium subeluteriae]